MCGSVQMFGTAVTISTLINSAPHSSLYWKHTLLCLSAPLQWSLSIFDSQMYFFIIQTLHRERCRSNHTWRAWCQAPACVGFVALLRNLLTHVCVGSCTGAQYPPQPPLSLLPAQPKNLPPFKRREENSSFTTNNQPNTDFLCDLDLKHFH